MAQQCTDDCLTDAIQSLLDQIALFSSYALVDDEVKGIMVVGRKSIDDCMKVTIDY